MLLESDIMYVKINSVYKNYFVRELGNDKV